LGASSETFGAWDPFGGVSLPVSATGYFVNPNAPTVPANFGIFPRCNSTMLVANERRDRNEYG